MCCLRLYCEATTLVSSSPWLEFPIDNSLNLLVTSSDRLMENSLTLRLDSSSVSNLAPPCDCHFIPSISVYAIPACHGHNNLNCGRIAFSMMDTYQEVLFPAHEMNPARCDMCNVKDGYMDRVEIKKCTGCKKVGFVSPILSHCY